MKAPTIPSGFSPVLLVLLFSFLFSCAKEEFSPGVADSSPSLQSLAYDPNVIMNPDSIDPGCSGTHTFDVPYSIVPTTSFQGYQWAIKVRSGDVGDAGTPADLTEGCQCLVDYYCITVEFPQTFVGGAAVYSVRGGQATLNPVDMDGNGGYFTPFYNQGNTGGNPQVHRICMAPADLLISLFQLPFGFPSGYNASNAVITVSGICTVDNLPSPVG